MAGLLKLHYPPTVYTLTVPCSGGIKPAWIMYAYEKGFDGVSLLPTGATVSLVKVALKKTGNIVSMTHEQMKEKELDPARLRMAAICSVCSEAFVKQIRSFNDYLLKTRNA